MFKLFVDQHSLSANVGLANRAVSSRPSHPILSCLKLGFDGDTQTATLTGFDLAISVEATFPVDIAQDNATKGVITLPAKLTDEIISKLPSGSLTLEGDLNGRVKVSSASGDYEIHGAGAEDFPETPAIKDGTQIQIPIGLFLTGLKYTLFATSSDESKQVLTGVRITIDPSGMEFAATDGHRLAVVNVPVLPPEDPEETPLTMGTAEVTIPWKALETLQKLLMAQEFDHLLLATFDAGQAVFEMSPHRMTSRLLDGAYPNYRQLIPTQFSKRLTIERKPFLKALELVSVLADLKNGIVRLSFDTATQVMTMEADAQDVGNAKEVLPVQFTGDDLSISFNAKYLAQALRIIETPEVTFDFNTATSPAVMRPLTGDKFCYLLMPVQVRSNDP